MLNVIYRALIDLSRSLGIDVQKVQGLDMQMRKLQSIKKPKTRLHAAEELVRKHPQHPKPHLELFKCLHILSDPREFEQLDRYSKVRREWLDRTALGELAMEFIWAGMVVGSLGNHQAIDGLLKANQYGLRPAMKPFLLLPQNTQLRNPALFSYFEPHLHVVRDIEAIQALKKLEPLLTLPLGLGLPMNNGCPFLDIAANLTEVEREKHGLDPTFFTLNDHHQEMGEKTLEKLGLPKEAWYVILHVREPGYRGETHENTKENWRNANPLDYQKACEVITRAGGWVFRMGDPSMTQLPQMQQVIDYAFHEIRSDWMDVFLGATCRFIIGTASGPIVIPMFFGKPILFTNHPGFVQYFGLRNRDLYLPRLLKNNRTHEFISFEEFMSPPISMFYSMDSYENAGVHYVENTPEELEAATREMLKRTDCAKLSNVPDDDLQRRFKGLAETCGLKYGGWTVKAFASISRDFLKRHVDLLEGIH